MKLISKMEKSLVFRDELREFLKKQPKPTAVVAPQRTDSQDEDGNGPDSSSESTSSSDSSSVS